MLNEHSKVGIAQTVFYVPALASIIYLNFHHGFRERSWILLLIFSCSEYCRKRSITEYLHPHPSASCWWYHGDRISTRPQQCRSHHRNYYSTRSWGAASLDCDHEACKNSVRFVCSAGAGRREESR